MNKTTRSAQPNAGSRGSRKMKELARIESQPSIEGYYKRQEYNIGDEYEKTTEGWNIDISRLLMSGSGQLFIQYGTTCQEHGDDPVNDGSEEWGESTPTTLEEWVEMGGRDPFFEQSEAVTSDYRETLKVARRERRHSHGMRTIAIFSVMGYSIR